MSKALQRIPLFLAALILGAAIYARWRAEPTTPAAIVARRTMSYEAWARAEFMRKHPGEKPLNWAIAEAGVRFYERKPMGRFVLGLGGEWGNDCSDFVECAVDEGLGVGARFDRDSEDHLLGPDRRLWDVFYWRGGVAVQPGDVISIRHSPWYDPYEGACWHVGVVGSDGMVYDFVKLKRWRRARYGRKEFDWFVQHCPGEKDVIIRRLAPEYRYRISPLPKPPSHISRDAEQP